MSKNSHDMSRVKFEVNEKDPGYPLLETFGRSLYGVPIWPGITSRYTRKLKTSGKVALARQMFEDQSHSIPEICAALGISRATLYRYVKKTSSPE